MDHLILNNIDRNELTLLISNAVSEQLKELKINASTDRTEIKYLSREETAKLLHISLPTLHQLTATGKITGYRLGNRILYLPEDIQNALIKIIQ